MKYFKFKVSYEDKTQTKITEQYLIDAVSFTEAEARAMEELQFYGNNLVVTNMSPVVFDDVISSGGDMFYSAKFAYTTLNETSGKEKTITMKVLVNADNFDTAYHLYLDYMHGGLSDYRIVSFTELPIVDVFKTL